MHPGRDLVVTSRVYFRPGHETAERRVCKYWSPWRALIIRFLPRRARYLYYYWHWLRQSILNIPFEPTRDGGHGDTAFSSAGATESSRRPAVAVGVYPIGFHHIHMSFHPGLFWYLRSVVFTLVFGLFIVFRQTAVGVQQAGESYT